MPTRPASRRQPRVERAHNYDAVAELVAERVEKSHARISAKRLLPIARAAGYEGSGRNFRRVVAEAKALWRSEQSFGSPPGGVVTGRVSGHRLGPGRTGVVPVLRGAGVLPLAVRPLRHRPTRVDHAGVDRRNVWPRSVVSPPGCWPTGWPASRAGWSPTWWSPPRTTCGWPATTASLRISATPTTRSPRASWRTCAATPNATWRCRC